MFLRCTNRKKDGKERRYWNVVENRRVAGGRVVQRQVLYLGEINGSQREAWRKTVEVFENGAPTARTMALFPEDRPVEIDDEQVVQIPYEFQSALNIQANVGLSHGNVNSIWVDTITFYGGPQGIPGLRLLV